MVHGISKTALTFKSFADVLQPGASPLWFIHSFTAAKPALIVILFMYSWDAPAKWKSVSKGKDMFLSLEKKPTRGCH